MVKCCQVGCVECRGPINHSPVKEPVPYVVYLLYNNPMFYVLVIPYFNFEGHLFDIKESITLLSAILFSL